MPPISIKDATLLQTNQSQRLPIERKKKDLIPFHSRVTKESTLVDHVASLLYLAYFFFKKNSVMIVQTSIWIRGT